GASARGAGGEGMTQQQANSPPRPAEAPPGGQARPGEAPSSGNDPLLGHPSMLGKDSSLGKLSMLGNNPMLGSPAHGKRILVVEDDPSIVLGLRMNLEAEGYVVDVAEDGEAGLALARARQADLIILDIMLPRLNG